MRTFLNCNGIGILGNDPTVFILNDQNVVMRFNVAYVSNYKKKQTSWITIEVIATSEYYNKVKPYLKKGVTIYFEGSLIESSYIKGEEKIKSYKIRTYSSGISIIKYKSENNIENNSENLEEIIQKEEHNAIKEVENIEKIGIVIDENVKKEPEKNNTEKTTVNISDEDVYNMIFGEDIDVPF